ncbi:MAG: Hpt domain-containing protein [Pseudomonadota bacterium]
MAEKTTQLSERNHSMRLILDNAEQGFLTCELDGTMGSEYSKIIESWFGKPREGQKIWNFLFDSDSARVATIFSMSWDQMTAEFLPFEVTADQMPKSFSHSGRHFSLCYTGIRDAEEKLQQLLIVASDVTAIVNADIKEREQQELLSMFQRISHDRVGFLEFFEDAERLVQALHNAKNAEEQFRIVHTLKGNCGQYGLSTVVGPCHVLESQLNETRIPLSHSEIAFMAQIWQQTSGRLVSLLGDRKKRTIELDEAECREIVKQLKSGASSSDIADSIERWCLDPLGARLIRFAEEAKFLSHRLGVEELEVEVQDQGIHLEPGSFLEIWSNMTHVIRNAVDHGLRGLDGVRPKLTFSAERAAESIRIRISDNGHGVSWEKVREKAKLA